MHSHCIIVPLRVQYRTIAGLEGYEVGSDGEMWSCRPRNGRGGLTGKWRRLKGITDADGYRRVTLCRDGKRGAYLVHRLVLEAFVGPCPAGMEGCHGNGNRADNRIGNLRWDNQEANRADAVRHGTARVGVKGMGGMPGEKHPLAKLTDDLVKRIVEVRAETGLGKGGICRLLGLPPTMENVVDMAIHGRSWTHVTGFQPPAKNPLKPSERIP